MLQPPNRGPGPTISIRYDKLIEIRARSFSARDMQTEVRELLADMPAAAVGLPAASPAAPQPNPGDGVEPSASTTGDFLVEAPSDTQLTAEVFGARRGGSRIGWIVGSAAAVVVLIGGVVAILSSSGPDPDADVGAASSGRAVDDAVAADAADVPAPTLPETSSGSAEPRPEPKTDADDEEVAGAARALVPANSPGADNAFAKDESPQPTEAPPREKKARKDRLKSKPALPRKMKKSHAKPALTTAKSVASKKSPKKSASRPKVAAPPEQTKKRDPFAKRK